jgi:hypothetical protein
MFQLQFIFCSIVTSLPAIFFPVVTVRTAIYGPQVE